MGQSGTPECDELTRVNNPSSPKKVEVVMGRCFPLSDLGHQPGTTIPVVRGVVYKEGRGAPGTKTKKSFVTIESRSRDKHVERQRGADEAVSSGYSSQSSVASSRCSDVQQNGLSYSCGGTPGSSWGSDDKPSIKQEAEEKKMVNKDLSESKPKQRPILRRTQSAAVQEPDDVMGNDVNAPRHEGEEKLVQEASTKEQLSGRDAWNIVQRKKALLREEFFRVPYEECNREAARSLGGRLNKSEPRLHTVGKERKKRNSLSYKRRVHFDLDDMDGDEEKTTKSKTKVHHSRGDCVSGYGITSCGQASRPVAAPKKVLVSIYSIDDGVKKVRHCDNSNQATCTITGEAPALRGHSEKEDREWKNRSQTRLKTARPTDLDSLQRQTTVGSPLYENRNDLDLLKMEKHKTVLPETSSPVTNGSCRYKSVVSEDNNFKTNVSGKPVGASFSSGSPSTPQLSVRPRSSSVASARLTKHTSEPSTLPVQSVPAAPKSGSAAISRQAQLVRSQSYQGHLQEAPSPSPQALSSVAKPRPGYLELSNIQTPTQTHIQAPKQVQALTHTPSPTHSPSPTQRSTIVRTPVPIPRRRLSKQTSPSTSQPSTPHTSQTSALTSELSTPHSSKCSAYHVSHPLKNSPSENLTHSSSQSSSPFLRNPKHISTHPSAFHDSQPPHTSQPQASHTSRQAYQLPSPITTHDPTLVTIQGSNGITSHPENGASRRSTQPNPQTSNWPTHILPHGSPNSTPHPSTRHTHITPQPSTHITCADLTHHRSIQPKQSTLQKANYITLQTPENRFTLSSTDTQNSVNQISSHLQENRKPELKSVLDSNNAVYPLNVNKENQRAKPNRKKTDYNERGNTVNILMTMGESYAKHNIVLNSRVISTLPTVTVKKILMPTASSPVRCSPSPTPSCASSSCSFGSSGSSSGCYSGSPTPTPTPTPTPSPTRIRASAVPTDL